MNSELKLAAMQQKRQHLSVESWISCSTTNVLAGAKVDVVKRGASTLVVITAL